MVSEGRRIVALVLPLLAPEIARETLGRGAISGGRPAPLAVLIDEVAVARAARQLGLDLLSKGDPMDVPTKASSTRDDDGARAIDAVCEVAHALGVRPGQRVSEASALTHGLVVAHVASRSIEAALARVADVALGVGPTVSIGPPDTVWVDVTGASHLAGGEEQLLAELEDRVASLGHRVRGAIADGPRIARALARHARLVGTARIVPPGASRDALAPLPVRALFQGTSPKSSRSAAKKQRANVEESDVVTLLGRLGVWTVGDLARLPAAATAARLGPSGQDVLALAVGRDPMPLAPHAPPASVIERVSLDDGIENAGALVFVARGLVSRASARLAARSEAASRLEIELAYDASIFALRTSEGEGEGQGVAGGATSEPGTARALSPSLIVAVDLPAPLSHESDLLRAVKAKIEALALAAPVVAVRITLSRIGKAPEVQLGIDRDPSLDPEAIPALLSELAAEIGEGRLGVLTVVDDLRPEAQARLEPPRLGPTLEEVDTLGRVSARRKRMAERRERELREAYGERASDFDADRLASPTRLFPSCLAVSIASKEEGPEEERNGKIEVGMSLAAGGRVFVVEAATFDRRVDGVRWWTRTPASRDYVRVWLRDVRAAAVATEAWIYVDRRERTAVIQGIWE